VPRSEAAASAGAAAGLIGYYFAFSREWPAGPSLVVAAALFLLPRAALRLFRRRR
jgi:hypothetical protein